MANEKLRLVEKSIEDTACTNPDAYFGCLHEETEPEIAPEDRCLPCLVSDMLYGAEVIDKMKLDRVRELTRQLLREVPLNNRQVCEELAGLLGVEVDDA